MNEDRQKNGKAQPEGGTSRDRTKNGQHTGHGSASALSRMKAIERKKKQNRAGNGRDNGGK